MDEYYVAPIKWIDKEEAEKLFPKGDKFTDEEIKTIESRIKANNTKPCEINRIKTDANR